MSTVSWGLFLIGLSSWLLLSSLFVLRLVLYFPLIIQDLRDPLRGPGFFTSSAGTCVIGSAVLVVAGEEGIAWAFWVLGTLLWVVVMYSFFSAIISSEKKATLEAGISGSWLVASVSTQAVAELGSLLTLGLSRGKEPIYFFLLCMHFAGAMLYLNIIPLIFYRITFLPLINERLSPSYWINMGALAITTLSGSTLVLQSGDSSLLSTLKPFLLGSSLFFWSAGTWWIPLLLIMGALRHLLRGFPLSYDASIWAGIFPLGMFTAATFRLALAAELPFLLPIPRYFIFLALAAWLLGFVGMVRWMGRCLPRPGGEGTRG